MDPELLRSLLRLPADERAELAMALWDSLDGERRGPAFELAPELAEELDRRVAEHVADPASAIPWPDVRRKLMGEV